jgi:hypothetical protein
MKWTIGAGIVLLGVFAFVRSETAMGGTMSTEQNKAVAKRWSDELWGKGNDAGDSDLPIQQRQDCRKLGSA